jgi:hypothetical protein
MPKITFLLTIFFMSLFPAVFSDGESLAVVDEIILSADKATYTGKEHARLFVTGVYLSGDTTFFSSIVGISAKIAGKTGYRKIIGREDWSDDWWRDFKTAKKENALFCPGPIWRMSGSDDLVVYDHRIFLPYTIDLQNKDTAIAKIWKAADEKSIVNSMSIYGDLICYGTISDFNDFILAISYVDMSDYRRVFKCPPSLRHRFDSVWADPDCIPAFNPLDSTIWLAFEYYDYIYIVDIRGDLLDSVHISLPDFRLPQPPRSRMHSDAVFQDWYSKCTPVESFRYVPPGYFLLQYRTGWEKLEADSIQLRSTLAWTADRTPVDLTVEKDWHLVGVQPDGRVIFAHYVVEDNKIKEIVLHIARIEP